ncbi:hypothetical protein FRX31_018370, partial [Thalictrum thalictroides]
IHQYMLTKAHPVPQLGAQQTSDEQATNQEVDAVVPQDGDDIVAGDEQPNPEADDRIVADVREVHVNANAGPLRVSFSAELSVSRHVPATGPSEQVQEVRVLQRSDDRLFTWAAVGLTLAIVVLLLKKFLRSSGVDVASIGGFK